ncbi:MAG: hypothetical protein JWO58_2297 [Chitinophagaceae bacterium]|nr:hypothetical protein [Chitinophagaceae bacterium]
MRYLFYSLAILLTCCTTSKNSDSKVQADKANEERAMEYTLDEPSAEFLVKIADGRLMGIREGEAAVKKGTTTAIKDYGRLMVNDQKRLLVIMETLALHKKIQLPQKISSDKQDGLKDLLNKKGKDFDEKFIHMMRIDHERDIRLFTDGQTVKDDEIRAFAVKYLPLIQSHLKKLNELDK